MSQPVKSLIKFFNSFTYLKIFRQTLKFSFCWSIEIWFKINPTIFFLKIFICLFEQKSQKCRLTTKVKKKTSTFQPQINTTKCMAIFLQISFTAQTKKYDLFENGLPKEKNTATQTTVGNQSIHQKQYCSIPWEVYWTICAHFQIIFKFVLLIWFPFLNILKA